MCKTPTATAAFLFLAALPVSLAGQDDGPRLTFEESVQVHGAVVDQMTGDPIPTALVLFSRVDVDGPVPVWSGGTDRLGAFRTTRLPLGVFQVQVEFLAYTPVMHVEVLTEAGDVDIRIEVAPVDFALEPIIVSARRETRLERSGFYDRALGGSGYFVTRSDIQAAAPMEMSDVFRQVPGVSVIPELLGSGGVVRLRNRCEPQFVLDGTPMSNPVYIDQLIAPSDVEAVEVYHGATGPIQYTQMSTCGTVMIWSRDPGTPTSQQVSLKKFLGAVGFLMFALFSTQ